MRQGTAKSAAFFKMELDPSRTLLRLLSNTPARGNPSGAPAPDAARAAVSTAETAALGLRTGELVTVRVLAEATAPMMQVTRANERGPTQASTPQAPRSEAGSSTPMQVSIKGRQLLAEVPLGTRPGDQFTARVVRTDGQPQLEALNRDALNRQASIVGHYRQMAPQARPHPDSLRALQRLSTGASLRPSPNAEPPRTAAKPDTQATTGPNTAGASPPSGNGNRVASSPGQQIANQILQGISRPVDLLQPEGFRAALLGSGVQFEQQLSQALLRPQAPAPASGAQGSAAANPDGTQAEAPDTTDPPLLRALNQLSGRDLKGALLLARAQIAAVVSAKPNTSGPAAPGVESSTDPLAQPARSAESENRTAQAARTPTASGPTTGGTPTAPGNPPGSVSSAHQMPAPNAPGNAPNSIAQLPGTASLASPIDATSAELRQVIDSMLAEIESQQLGQHIARDEGLPRIFELPLLPDSLLRRVEIAVDEAPQGTGETRLGDEETSLTLRLDLGEAGPLLVKIRYAQNASSPDASLGRVAITLTARRASLADAIAEALPDLGRALNRAGLEVRHLEGRLGNVPDRLRRAVADRNIINVRT